MSLINKMLLDLEQRQSELNSEPALAGLSSVDYCTAENRRVQHTGRALFTIAGIALVALAFLSVWNNSDWTDSGTSQSLERENSVPDVPVPLAHPTVFPETGVAMDTRSGPLQLFQLEETLSSLARISAQEPATAAPEPLPAQTTAVNVSAIKIQAMAGAEQVNIHLTGAAKFTTYPLSNSDRVVVEIAGASVVDSLAQSETSPMVQRVRARNERGKALIVLDLTGPAEVESAMLDDQDGAARLQLQLTAHTPANRSSGSKSDNPMSLTTQDDVVQRGHMTRNPSNKDRLFDEGAALCRNGNVVAGLAKLTELVTREPDHVAGRELLATVLSQNGDMRQGVATLDAGLRQFPHIWQWAQLRAQIAVNAGDLELAHRILVGASPPLAEQPEYHALLAAVQQRTGRHGEAVTTYHAVLGKRAERGLWWMGLGISLQALARGREAGFAFQRALDDATLSQELRGFVRTRMNSLARGAGT